MQSGRVTIIAAAALLLALAGCGAGSDTRTPTEQLIAVWGETADLLNEMADAIGGIESQATANAVAMRVEGEFLPRMHSIAASVHGAFEAMSEEELATLEETMREDGDARAALERVSRSGQRLDERTSQLEPRFVTSAFEESMLAFAQSVEQLEGGSAAIVGGGTAQPEIGGAAWCREMADKPEAQWTMNEAFAFASRCVGG